MLLALTGQVESHGLCVLSGVGSICYGVVFRDPLSLDLSKPIHVHGWNHILCYVYMTRCNYL